jgi:sugar lactone lactonase YvrE
MFFVALILGCPTGVRAENASVSFVGEYPAGKPVSLAVGEGGNLYVAQDGGTIMVLDAEGRVSATYECADERGRRLLKEPSGMSFSDGKLYAVDSDRNEVLIFSPECVLLDRFGDGGKGNKEFRSPRGVFVAGGIVYVADTKNDRVQVYGPNGVYIGTIGVYDDIDDIRNTIDPLDVLIDANGNSYIIDGNRNWVQAVRSSREHMFNLVGLEKPVALALGMDGIFVADEKRHKIIKYSATGGEVFAFGAEGREGRGMFLRITDIAVDRKGRIYVSDRAKGTVQVFQEAGWAEEAAQLVAAPPTYVLWKRNLPYAPDYIHWDGKRLFAVMTKARRVDVIENGAVVQSMPLPFEPFGVATDPRGDLWVVDGRNDKIHKLSSAGAVVLSVGSPGSKEGHFDDPMDLAISRTGIIYVVERGNGRIQRVNIDGMFLGIVAPQAVKYVERPVAIAIDTQGGLFVLDEKNERVAIFDKDGNPVRTFGGPGFGMGTFTKPADLDIFDTEIFVLDSGNYRIQVFTLGGRFVREFGAEGEGKGDFKRARAMAVVGHTIYVSDAKLDRTQVLDIVYTPAAPQYVDASAGMRRITLGWAKSAEKYIATYRVYRSDRLGYGYQQLVETLDNSYIDVTATPGVRYYYRVTAVSSDGVESNMSRAVKSMADKYEPPSPTGVSAAVRLNAIDITWKPVADIFLKNYRVFRQEGGVFRAVGDVMGQSYTDATVEPDKTYHYRVASVSVDDVESAGNKTLRVVSLPDTTVPVDLEILEVGDIFSNMYKIYETDGIGRVRVVNNTRRPIGGIKISFTIRNFMDFPSEMKIDELAPGDSRELVMKTVFNNNILTVTEDTPVQAELKAMYYRNEEPREYVKNFTIQVFERHHLRWDDRAKIATFVTPKDAPVLEFARQIITQYSLPQEQSPLVYAAAIFDALGIHGMTYVQDPTNPYQVTSGSVDTVDYVQYPRETLERKSGDCDDLVALLASALESVGVRTLLVDYPGHILLMLSTGIEVGPKTDTMQGMFIEHEGVLWVPVEATLVGQPFMKAWEAGSSAYWQNVENNLVLVDVKQAWKTYKPASLRETAWRAEAIDRKTIESQYAADVTTLQKVRMKNRTEKYLARIEANPDDMEAANLLGIAYADFGLLNEALNFFLDALSRSPDDAALRNNIGNVYFLRDMHAEARISYEAAIESDPSDPLLYVNLTRCLIKLGRKSEANKAFRRAYSMDPNVFKEYRELSLQLM